MDPNQKIWRWNLHEKSEAGGRTKFEINEIWNERNLKWNSNEIQMNFQINEIQKNEIQMNEIQMNVSDEWISR